ncbi:hypothetical protein Rcae01_05576 [Novipirellula caenicola]|uniref:Uncharacterized protein n=1 Tax=Novipirellula caenicola TaxID=1536901 RepID=A0ABP9VZS8_9BACT
MALTFFCRTNLSVDSIPRSAPNEVCRTPRRILLIRNLGDGLSPAWQVAHTAGEDRKIGATERFQGRGTGQPIPKSHRSHGAMADSLFVTRGWAGRWGGAGKFETGDADSLATVTRVNCFMQSYQSQRDGRCSCRQPAATQLGHSERLEDGGLENGEALADQTVSRNAIAASFFCRTNISVDFYTTMVTDRDLWHVPSHRVHPHPPRAGFASVSKSRTPQVTTEKLVRQKDF